MLLVDGKKDGLYRDYVGSIKDQIGDGRYMQSPQELLSKLKTRDENIMVTVGPHMGMVEFQDTFYGTIQRCEDEKDPQHGFIMGIDFDPNARTADHHKVRYYEDATVSQMGILEKFKPEYFQIGGTNRPNTACLPQEDYEKFWFLSTICRRVKNSLNAGANTTKDFIFEITNPELDATKERVGSKWKRKLDYLLNEEAGDGGFTDAELTNIARHLQLPVKSYRNTDQLRKAIFATAAADEGARQLSGDPKVNGYEYVVLLGQKKGPDYELRSLITDATEKGIIAHDADRKQWVYKAGGNVIGAICPVDPLAPIKTNVLISFLKLDHEAREKLQGLMTQKEDKKLEVKKEEKKEEVK